MVKFIYLIKIILFVSSNHLADKFCHQFSENLKTLPLLVDLSINLS